MRKCKKYIAGVSNEMVSIHDFFPTLASIAGAEPANEKPIDGVDQSSFFMGKSPKSARESLISFIDNQIVAVRWKQWRIYPQQFIESSGNPTHLGIGSYRVDGVGYPAIFNIEQDPREQWNQVGTVAWVISSYIGIVGKYKKSLVDFPNPVPFRMTKFD